MSKPEVENKTNKENETPSDKNKKGKVYKALMIGFAVGVMFIVAAKMVNSVMS